MIAAPDGCVERGTERKPENTVLADVQQQVRWCVDAEFDSECPAFGHGYAWRRGADRRCFRTNQT